jgi:hypothetical protein
VNAPEDIDAAFRAVRFTRGLDKLGARMLDADFWRALNPKLTISDVPPAEGAEPFASAWAEAPVCRQRLLTEGFTTSPALIEPQELHRLRVGVERVVAAGLPPGCALMYDEYHRVVVRLLGALSPLLGPNAVMVPEDFWVFHVPPGDAGVGRWTAFPPHRDQDAPDPAMLAGQLPAMLNAWVALSDASTDQSCMYVVPANCDPDYRSDIRAVNPARFRLEDIRAVPLAAGQVLLFEPHLAHWGSRSSQWARGPRISLAGFLQRADGPKSAAETANLRQPLTVRQRATWVLRSLRMMVGERRCKAVGERVGIELKFDE